MQNSTNVKYSYEDNDESSSYKQQDSSYNTSNTQDNKQEIKTVRIVKRENKERQRDKNEKGIQNLDQVLEEELRILNEQEQTRRRNSLSQKSRASSNPFASDYNVMKSDISPDSYPVTMHDYSEQSVYRRMDASKYQYLDNSVTEPPVVTLRNKTESIQSLTKTIGELDYQSEAAKQIITEVSSSSTAQPSAGNPQVHKRNTPREKRRHNTAPHHVNIDSIELMRKIEHINRSVSDRDNQAYPTLPYQPNNRYLCFVALCWVRL